MADGPSTEQMFDVWRKQLQAGAEAWTKAVQQMGSAGQAPPSPLDPAAFWRQFTDPGASVWAGLQGPGPIDPQVLAQWKRFLDDWIAAWSGALEQAMGTEAFAESLGKTLDQFLTAQGKAKEAASRVNKVTLETLNLPSRDQIVGLSRQLMDLEDKLEALEDRLDGQTAAPAKARTKSAPAKARKKSKATKTRQTQSRTKRKTDET